MRHPTIFLALSCTFALTHAALAAGTSGSPPRHATAARLRPRVSADSARVIASARVPGGRVKSQELENEKGHLIYSFDFETPGKPGIDEVNVDALSGAVLAVQHEGAKAERLEKAQERKEMKKPVRHR